MTAPELEQYWRRETTNTPLNQAAADAWLLQKFPGRTLDELDGMDWGRFMRAVEVQQVMEVEGRYKAFAQQRIKELPAAEVRTLQAHEELLSKYGNR